MTHHALVLTDLLFTPSQAAVAAQPLVEAGWEIEHRQWTHADVGTQQEEMFQIERFGPDLIESASFQRPCNTKILIVGFAPVSAAWLKELPQLQLIAINRAGTENISEKAAQLGIAVANTGGRNARAVAEYTIALMLAEARNIARSHANLKNGRWTARYANTEHVLEIGDSIVGLIGFGHIGRLVAEILRGFGCRILVYDPYAAGLPPWCEPSGLNDLLASADIVSIHARLGPETRHLINADRIATMKSTAILVNTARAELIDESALSTALQTGALSGAALDVFGEEPVTATNPLVSSDRTTVTPHLAGMTQNAASLGPRMLAASLRDYLAHDNH